MDKQELLELLRETLSIKIKEDFGYYGEHSLTFDLTVDGEVISSDTIHMPKACNCKCGSAY